MFSQNILWPLKHFIIKLFQFYLLQHSIWRIKIWLQERLPFGFLLLIFSEREKGFHIFHRRSRFYFETFSALSLSLPFEEKCIFEGNTQKYTHAMFIFTKRFIALCAYIILDELAFIIVSVV